jgi:hypothetical protein
MDWSVMGLHNSYHQVRYVHSVTINDRQQSFVKTRKRELVLSFAALSSGSASVTLR